MDAWCALHDRLHDRLLGHAHRETFLEDVLLVAHDANALLASRVDLALFTLVQMLFEPNRSYSTVHALLCAAICRLVAPLAAISREQQTSLFNAALTMNIGMSSLHDALRLQASRPDPVQEAAILRHPEEGARKLRSFGVEDAGWLEYVREHHETVSGKGYPSGKRDLSVATRVLQMADVFVGRISPRSYREGLSPRMAMRNLYLGADGNPDPLGAVFVKMLGVYIPGSYVQLANREVAVVVKRGELAHTPLVMSLVGSRGAPLREPAIRDTSDAEQRIANSVRVQISRSRLLALLS
jgi:HD-GYP domain-containing protein (c-di-GMP phosphodiesterase class II)